MKKLLFIFIMALLCSVAAAQTGGIKATVVSRAGRTAISGVKVSLRQGVVTVADVNTDAEGRFQFDNLPDGSYSLELSSPDFTGTQVNVIVEKGLMRDLMMVTLSPAQQLSDFDESNFTEFDLSDSGYSDAPTILYSANDVFNNIAGYGFSAIRFKNRGYDASSQDVYLAGVYMNDALTGNTPFSLWTGLNEAMRAKDTTVGLESSDFGVGGYNGLTNILAVPSSVRKGWRFSVLSNSALYRLRLMGTYSSGELDNGWSYAFNVSARLGGNDWVKGVYYRSFAFYGGVEKKFGTGHRLALFAFATPGQRGAQNASTQEVYDLMGDNFYNSNWGYQNGKVRNARVRKTFEPVVGLKYSFTPNDDFSANAAVVVRTGKNGYTALDWYDAPDPRPDYYRNLPSFAYMSDDDYERYDSEKAEWMKYAWTQSGSSFDNYKHINWDRLYNVNYNSAGGRSKYVVEERHVDQNEISFAGNFKWMIDRNITLLGGLDAKWNRTENYKVIDDLLGGKYYVNVDQFAERDFASDPIKIQNDLDYYLAHGEAQKLQKGDKYGYDYYAFVQKYDGWLNGSFTSGYFKANLAGKAGYDCFWREGLVRKGLFPDNSLGKSAVKGFFTYTAKASAEYDLLGGHRFALNAGYFNEAPTFTQGFVSPRTRNTLTENLTTKKTFAADFTYQFTNSGYNLRATAFFTDIKDQSDVMSFYDDSQHSFTNFAMTGLGQRHLGVEIGAKAPLPVNGLSVSAALSLGRYVYTGTPHMVQTVDNSAETVRDEDVPYWSSHPIYKIAGYDAYNKPIYDQDAQGNYIITGYQQHFVTSTPQLASEIALNYRGNDYLFIEVNGQYFSNSYLDMNPLYRTTFACSGPDGVLTPAEVENMASQERFSPTFLLNASVGKSWQLAGRKYNLGFSLEAKNLLNNLCVKTGGYEQTRLISSSGRDRYYRFDSKYFYMTGINYMLNIYFKF